MDYIAKLVLPENIYKNIQEREKLQLRRKILHFL